MRYDYKTVYQKFVDENYELLEKEYKNTYQKLKYICNKHSNKGIQEVTMNAFDRGKRCPYCKYEKGIFVNPLPEDIIQEETEKRGYIYCGIERAQHTKVKIICPIHQEYGIQLKNWSDIKAGKQVCSRCNGHKSLEEFQKIVHEKSPNVDIIGDFDYCSKRVHCKCNICGYEWNPLGYNLTTKRFTGCPKCSEKIRADKRAISYAYVQEKFKKLEKSIVPLSIPTRTHEAVKCKCKKCGRIWYATFSNLTKKNNPTGCIYCNMSSNEKRILQYLESKNISVEVQKTFDDCKLERKLPFDFYLPHYNVCIEADGQFHYIDNIFDKDNRHEYNKLENVQYRDSIKTKYCEEHGIKLIRIPYWEYDNIEKIIDEIINYPL